MAEVLPDLLGPNLKVVFCGTAAGARSAQMRAYYAGSGNKFWKTLHRVGLTDRVLLPTEFATLPAYGIGLTDLAKGTSGADSTLLARHFDREALRSKIAQVCPRALAFNGKKAAQTFFNVRCAYGRQEERIGDTSIYVLPSTSGAANGHWDEAHWRQLPADLA